MSAEELVRSGRLDDALAALQADVRADPSSSRHRIFLFELHALRGDWDRAATQLQVVADMDASTLAVVHMYRTALLCEKLRADIFAGKRAPLVFGEPPMWIAQLIEGLSSTNDAEKVARISAAFEEAPELHGTINGEAFEWLADADARFGPTLEVIMDGKYYWVPLANVSRIHVEPPKDLRDQAWMPANFVWSNGGEGFGLIPTRYPGTERCEDDRLKLARLTEWREIGEGMYEGLGQRMLATDGQDYALMDVREIVVSAP